ncbi:hypothetical protein HZS_5906, partial [Henneguya salminicola]
MVDFVRKITCLRNTQILMEIEDKIFNAAEIKMSRFYVELNGLNIWTGSNIPIDNIKNIDYEHCPPILLIHGIFCNLSIWIQNIKHLEKYNNPIFALDLPGFGLSSRISFPDKIEDIEEKFCDILMAWQMKMGLKKIIIMSHSLGAYISCCYSILNPSSVISLILVEPWGFLETKTYLVESIYNNGVTYLLKLVTSCRFIRVCFCKIIYPFLLTDLLRFLGIKCACLMLKIFENKNIEYLSKNLGLNGSQICCEYLYAANAFFPRYFLFNYFKSGEQAFFNMMNKYCMAKQPLIHRISGLNHLKKLYFIYGKNSFIDYQAGMKAQEILDKTKTLVHLIPQTEHIPQIQASEKFNDLVQEILQELN